VRIFDKNNDKLFSAEYEEMCEACVKMTGNIYINTFDWLKSLGIITISSGPNMEDIELQFESEQHYLSFRLKYC
jgi:hypothetical protein